ncbi:hypothetical protein CARUB_v10015890mg, partial [Capsella rubella]
MIGWTIANLVVPIILLIVLIVTVTRSESSNSCDAKIDELLNKLNKPALKSIKSPDGDIIDCVHFKNHPIYNHPLFKNHTIQMRPSSYPDGHNNSKPEKQNLTSIPIVRTRKQDILRAESIARFGKKGFNSIPQLKPTNTTIKVNSPRAKFHGAKAVINVWKPYVQTVGEFSFAQIWVSAGRQKTLNNIEAGWQVVKKVDGDDKPRYFVYWTADGYRSTGCYNLDCPGFVTINQRFALGGIVPRVSTLNGQQEVIPTTIWKDSLTGNWWLKFSTNLNFYWAGEIVDMKEGSKHRLTQMGSGHFAENGWKKASYFNNVEIIDQNDITKAPINPYTSATNANCYNI